MPPGLGTSPRSRPQAHPSMLLLDAQWSAKGQVWTSESWVQVLTSHVISDKSPSLRWIRFWFWQASPRSPATDWRSPPIGSKRDIWLNREQDQAPHVVRIVTHAHTGAMSSGLRLDVLLWLLSHATKVSVALNDLKAQDKDKQAQSCVPFGGYREKRTGTGSCALWRPHGGTDGCREEGAFLMWVSGCHTGDR